LRKLEPERHHNKDRNARIKPKKRFSTAQTAENKRNILWNISFDDYELLIKQPCYYCSFEFGRPVSTGSGLDRLDNNKGYEIINVVSCCELCNKLRNNFLS